MHVCTQYVLQGLPASPARSEGASELGSVVSPDGTAEDAAAGMSLIQDLLADANAGAKR